MILSPYGDIIALSLRIVKCFSEKSVVFCKKDVVLCWFRPFCQMHLSNKEFFGQFDKKLSRFGRSPRFRRASGSFFLPFQIGENGVDALMVVTAGEKDLLTAGKS